MRLMIARAAGALALGASLSTGVLLTTTGPAGADYGQGATYQIEISANTPPTSPQAAQGNFWIWLALTPSSSGATSGISDYQEADCIHLGGGHATDAAAHDAGSGAWYISNGTLYLTGVNIIGNAETATFAVPLPTSGSYGHTNGMTMTVTSGTAPIPNGIPLSYPSQNQIAP
jgi:hypothetical protein